MSLECSECEADIRGGHLDFCSRYDPAMALCRCDPEWQPQCPVHGLAASAETATEGEMNGC